MHENVEHDAIHHIYLRLLFTQEAATEGKAREVVQAAGSKSGGAGSAAAKSGPADNSWAAPAAFLVGYAQHWS